MNGHEREVLDGLQLAYGVKWKLEELPGKAETHCISWSCGQFYLQAAESFRRNRDLVQAAARFRFLLDIPDSSTAAVIGLTQTIGSRPAMRAPLRTDLQRWFTQQAPGSPEPVSENKVSDSSFLSASILAGLAYLESENKADLEFSIVAFSAGLNRIARDGNGEAEASLRWRRGEAYLKKGALESAIADLTRAAAIASELRREDFSNMLQEKLAKLERSKSNEPESRVPVPARRPSETRDPAETAGSGEMLEQLATQLRTLRDLDRPVFVLPTMISRNEFANAEVCTKCSDVTAFLLRSTGGLESTAGTGAVLALGAARQGNKKGIALFSKVFRAPRGIGVKLLAVHLDTGDIVLNESFEDRAQLLTANLLPWIQQLARPGRELYLLGPNAIYYSNDLLVIVTCVAEPSFHDASIDSFCPVLQFTQSGASLKRCLPAPPGHGVKRISVLDVRLRENLAREAGRATVSFEDFEGPPMPVDEVLQRYPAIQAITLSETFVLLVRKNNAGIWDAPATGACW